MSMINALTVGHNSHAKPFIWAATAQSITEKVERRSARVLRYGTLGAEDASGPALNQGIELAAQHILEFSAACCPCCSQHSTASISGFPSARAKARFDAQSALARLAALLLQLRLGRRTRTICSARLRACLDRVALPGGLKASCRALVTSEDLANTRETVLEVARRKLDIHRDPCIHAVHVVMA